MTEFALIAPILIVLVFAVIQFGVAFNFADVAFLVGEFLAFAAIVCVAIRRKQG